MRALTSVLYYDCECYLRRLGRGEANEPSIRPPDELVMCASFLIDVVDDLVPLPVICRNVAVGGAGLAGGADLRPERGECAGGRAGCDYQPHQLSEPCRRLWRHKLP